MKNLSLRKILTFTKSKWKNLLVLLLIVGLIPLSLREALRRQDLRSGAAPGDTVLSFVPQTQTVGINESGFMDVFVNTNGDEAGSVQLIIDYDDTLMQIDSVVAGEFFTSQQSTIGAPLIMVNTANNGRINFLVSFPIGSNFASSQVAPVARINYTMIGEGTANLTPVMSGLSRSKVNDLAGVDLLGTFNSGSVTASASNGPSLYFDNLNPVNPQTAGNQFTATLRLDTQGQDVSGVDAKVTFDPSVIQVQSIQETTGNGFNSYPASTFDNTAGTMNISANIGTSTTPNPVNGNGISLANITFVGSTAAANALIDFDFTLGSANDSNIVLFNQQSGSEPSDILAMVSPLTIVIQDAAGPTPTPITATPTPTPTPTGICNFDSSGNPICAVPSPISCPAGQTSQPSQDPCGCTRYQCVNTVPSPTPTPTVTPAPTPTPTVLQSVLLRLRFQGRASNAVSRIKDVAIRTLIAGSSGNGNVINATTDNSGEAQISVTPASYRLVIDAPGYLARRYGSNLNPLNMGTSTSFLDLTSAPLLGGDFNNDGEINEVDYTLYFLNNFLTSDSLVDLDGSGEVNNLDFAIMRSNWGLVDESFD